VSDEAARPLRVGLVGCGNVALNFHVPAYAATSGAFELVAVADPTAERLELGRATAGLSERDAYTDPTDLLARADVDVVDVCTPQHLHRPLIEAAAAAGKHILCEKPLASVPADADRAIAAAERAGVVLAVMHNYLFFPEVVAVKRILDSGELGDIRVVQVDYLGVVDSPGAGAYRPGWRHDPAAAGGGVLMDMVHAVYLAEHLLGRPVERVSAYVDSTRANADVEELALVRLEADHRVAQVNMAWGYGPGGIAVTGTQGRLRVDYRDGGTPPWAPFERLVVTTYRGTRQDPLPRGQELAALVLSSMTATLLDLADSIAAGRPPAADGRQAGHILETTLASYASAALGRTEPAHLDRAGPVYGGGVTGIGELAVEPWSAVSRDRLYGARRPDARAAS
jgi:predicted dehydrogenase